MARSWMVGLDGGFEKIMVIGSEVPPSLSAIFQAATSKVTNVPDGKMAVSRAQHEMFDTAILISTGEEMDLAETVFNLRDISNSMRLIILSDQTSTIRSAVPTNKRVSYVFDPFVNAMNATPRVALLPLVIIWLGIGILSKVGIIFLGEFFRC